MVEVRILGVHWVEEALEPCALIEIEIDDVSQFDWSEVTQEVDGQPRDNWQAPWDERPLNRSKSRWAFFFHYLDPTKPLLMTCGPLTLPNPTPCPAHLKAITYEGP